MTRSGPNCRGRTPGGLFGLLALVAIIEWAIAGHAPDLTFGPVWDWRQAGWAGRHRAAGSEILCFGDSQVKFGVQPRVLEDVLKKRSYNLSMIAGQAPGSYFLLRRALESGARPSAIVVDFEPSLLRMGLNTRAWSELLEPRECLEIARSSRDADLFGRLLTSVLVPSVRCRSDLRGALMGALRGRPVSQRGGVEINRRNFDANRGAQVMPLNATFRGAPVASLEVQLNDAAWRPDPVNASYVRKLFALARSRGIAVYWVLLPVTPEGQARREQVGSDARYSRFVERVHAKFPEVTVIDVRHSGYDVPVFADAMHLDRRGATALTTDLAAIIARGQSGPRRQVLPAFRDRPDDRSLEDTSQTAWLLEHRALRRR
jgi:hypothetical protein